MYRSNYQPSICLVILISGFFLVYVFFMVLGMGRVRFNYSSICLVVLISIFFMCMAFYSFWFRDAGIRRNSLNCMAMINFFRRGVYNDVAVYFSHL